MQCQCHLLRHRDREDRPQREGVFRKIIVIPERGYFRDMAGKATKPGEKMFAEFSLESLDRALCLGSPFGAEEPKPLQEDTVVRFLGFVSFCSQCGGELKPE